MLEKIVWIVQHDEVVVGVSEEKKPTFVLDKAGRWDLELITESKLGCKDTLRKPQLFAVFEQTASLTESPQPVVTFTNHPEEGGSINIQMLTALPAVFQLEIVDATQKIIYQEEIQSKGGTYIHTYRTTSLPKGNYRAVLKQGNWAQSAEFTKE